MPGICYNPVSQTEWIKKGQVSLLSPHPLFQSIFRPKVLSLSRHVSHALSFLGWTPRAFLRHALGFSLLYCPSPPRPPHAFPPPCTGTRISTTQHTSVTSNPVCLPHALFKGSGCFYFKKETAISRKTLQIHTINRFHWSSYFSCHWWKCCMRLAPRLIPKDLQK